MKIMETASGVALGQLPEIVNQTGSIVQKQKKQCKTSVTPLMRVTLKAILTCKNLPDIETDAHFNDFLNGLMNDPVVAPIINEINH